MKKLIPSIATALTLLFSSPAKADDTMGLPSYVHESTSGPEEQVAVLGVNVAFGGLVGCIGAEISGDGCLEGLWRGSLGGFVTYTGMEVGSYAAEIPFTGLLGRSISDLGTSIVSNAAYSRGFIERYETSFGPLFFSIDRNEGFSLYLQPISICAIGYHLFLGHELAPLDSIEDGTLVFYLNRKNNPWNSAGYTQSNIYSYIPGIGNVVRSHEVVHTFQGSRFNWVNDLLPHIWRFRYGAELVQSGLSLQSNINQDFYNYSPIEAEAFVLEKRR